jgi:hypothetical protein
MSKNYAKNKNKDKNRERELVYKNGKIVGKTNDSDNPNIQSVKKKLQEWEQDEIAKRIYHLVKNKVNFISGTVAPAPSSKNEDYLNIEDLKIGLTILTQSYGNNLTLSVQPKYMGSRCNVYLFNGEPTKSYSVSRNGYVISNDRVDMMPIYEKLQTRLKSWMDTNLVEMVILDGELLPWSALGKGLIENDFVPVRAGLESEIECSEKYNFDANYNQMIKNLNQLIPEKEFAIMEKKIAMEKIPTQYPTYHAYFQSRKLHQDTQTLRALYSTYSTQMDLYGGDKELDYKPFGILKIIYKDGTESIPLLDQSMGQSQMYDLVSSGLETDSQLVINITQENFLDSYNQINQWFDRKTAQDGFEGIILKPDLVQKDKIPLMKVRNQDYLTIIYGYDYKLEPNYKNLVNKKTTRYKIAQSIKEFKLGLNLLTMKYNNLDSDEYKSRLENFISCELNGNNLDPRL